MQIKLVHVKVQRYMQITLVHAKVQWYTCSFDAHELMSQYQYECTMEGITC